jgi:hypothetical protein
MELENEADVFISETGKTGIGKTVYIGISEISYISRIRLKKRSYYMKKGAFARTGLARYGKSISFFYFQVGFI